MGSLEEFAAHWLEEVYDLIITKPTLLGEPRNQLRDDLVDDVAAHICEAFAVHWGRHHGEYVGARGHVLEPLA